MTYSYLVTNTGNVTITNLSLSDDNVDAAPTCDATTIAVGGSTTCSAMHTFTQVELDANGDPTGGSGQLRNIVTATSMQTPPAKDTLDIPIVQSASMTIVKTADSTSLSAPGVVTYSYLVTNTGNVTITNLSLSDDNVDAAPTCDATTIAVGGSTTCSAMHTFTQLELDANGDPTGGSGQLRNIVTATSMQTPPAKDTLDIPIVQSASMTIVKTADSTSLSAPGVVTYSYLVTNTGNVTITNLSLSDDNVDAAPTCDATTIAVGGSTTCSAMHTFTQLELDANGDPTGGSGQLRNIVTATSIETPPAKDTLDIPIVQSASMTIVKTADSTSLSAPGVVTYSYLVTNTGNVTITNLSLSDDNIDAAPTCDATTIAVGGSTTCSAIHTFTQAGVGCERRSDGRQWPAAEHRNGDLDGDASGKGYVGYTDCTICVDDHCKDG